MRGEIVEKLPSIMIDRPKMPRATWDSLRAHIVRERLKKKQEQEQTEEVKCLNSFFSWFDKKFLNIIIVNTSLSVYLLNAPFYF